MSPSFEPGRAVGLPAMMAAVEVEAYRRAAAALADADDDVLEYVVTAIASLTHDDEEDAVTVIEATVGCTLSEAEACAVRELSRALPQLDPPLAPQRRPNPSPLLAAPSGGSEPVKGAATAQRSRFSAALGAAHGGGGPTARAPAALPSAAVRIVRADGSTLALLQEMCPHVPRSVIEHVLVGRCRGDEEEAVEQLLQMGGEEVRLLAAQLEREAARAREREDEARRQEREKKRSLVGRYEDVPMGAGGAPLALERGRGKTAAKGAAEVRFRDNEVANVGRGQKFILESTTPEWDGGSRGQVKTKGKRGKGFV